MNLREWVLSKQKEVKLNFPEPKDGSQISKWLYKVDRKKAECWNELIKKIREEKKCLGLE